MRLSEDNLTEDSNLNGTISKLCVQVGVPWLAHISLSLLGEVATDNATLSEFANCLVNLCVGDNNLALTKYLGSLLVQPDGVSLCLGVVSALYCPIANEVASLVNKVCHLLNLFLFHFVPFPRSPLRLAS